MADIVSTDLTVIGSVKVSPDDSSLRLVDVWIEPSLGVQDGDSLAVSELGVSSIRAVLEGGYLDGGNWANMSSTDNGALIPEQRMRLGYQISGSSATAPAIANDGDNIGFVMAATRDAVWLQLLVEA